MRSAHARARKREHSGRKIRGQARHGACAQPHRPAAEARELPRGAGTWRRRERCKREEKAGGLRTPGGAPGADELDADARRAGRWRGRAAVAQSPAKTRRCAAADLEARTGARRSVAGQAACSSAARRKGGRGRGGLLNAARRKGADEAGAEKIPAQPGLRKPAQPGHFCAGPAEAAGVPAAQPAWGSAGPAGILPTGPAWALAAHSRPGKAKSGPKRAYSGQTRPKSPYAGLQTYNPA
jgi:hypothetical protein